MELGRLLGIGAVNAGRRKVIGHVELQQRTFTPRGERQAARSRLLGEANLEVLRPAIHVADRVARQVADRHQSRSRGDRVAVEGAAVEHLGVERIAQLHQVGPTAHRPDGEATSDDLRHGGQVGPDALGRLPAALGQPQSDDLVEDDERAGRMRRVDDPGQEALGRGQDPRRAHHRFEDDARDLARVTLEHVHEGREVAELCQQRVAVLEAEGAALELGHRAVVAVARHQHLLASGPYSGDLDGEHRGLAPRVGEAHLVD